MRIGKRDRPIVNITVTILFVFGLVAALSSCSSPDVELPGSDTTFNRTPGAVSEWPEVDVFISMEDTVLSFGDSIMVNVRLGNRTNQVQKVLFMEPKLCSGGPWHTVATIVDVRTGKSVVKIANKAVLCSQSYGGAELEKYFHVLNPGDSVSGRFELNNLVTFDTEGYDLHRGTYDMWIACSSSDKSNVVRFTVN